MATRATATRSAWSFRNLCQSGRTPAWPYRHAEARRSRHTAACSGDPLYTYVLKQGINNGFLTSSKVRQMASTLDSYKLSDGDHVLSGEIDLVFCATQDHAVRVRNFINQVKDNPTRIIAKVARPKTTSSASSTCASFSIARRRGR